MSLFELIHHPYVHFQARVLAPFINPKESVLDFGCGDLSLAQHLRSLYPGLRVSGADVVDEHRRVKGIAFTLYDGTTLPFPDKSFDTVYSYHVYHHCEDPKEQFLDCIRVSRKRVIFVEPVIRNLMDNLGIRWTDWVFNTWRRPPIALPYHFLSREQWYRIFAANKLVKEVEKNVGVLPSLLPIGGTYLFVVRAP